MVLVDRGAGEDVDLASVDALVSGEVALSPPLHPHVTGARNTTMIFFM